MNFKLLPPLLETGCFFSNFVMINNKLSFRLRSYILSRKVRFSSQSNNDDFSQKSQLKKLLGTASPLEPTPEAENFWATSPYPEGTVFGISESEENQLESKPKETSIIMFPGQGNQFVGMADNLLKFPVVKDMFCAASEILGYDLLKICREGPEEKLNQTEYCQPATLVCSLAALEKLKDEKPWAINNCVATCGYSLGEFSALVFAGCINFERAVKLVKLRAEAMTLCCKMAEGGMLTVLYGADSTLKEALRDAIQHCTEIGVKNPQCSVASFLFPCCKVIGGNIEALNYLIENFKKYRLRKLSKLPVSGGFHTNLMKEAAEPFKEALEKVQLEDPLIKVYSNVTGKVYLNASEIKKKLPQQIYLPVKWEQMMHCAFKRPKGIPFPFVYECGPGNSLCTILKKMNISSSLLCYAVRL